ncbi:MAG: inositol monophosphatase [Actinobacteria bacterium HGW-Actinobacteria-10]|nr:MAG: inositol monophosphatase [Actinobacteria bacterium HGW-Actinobacteria-10]
MSTPRLPWPRTNVTLDEHTTSYSRTGGFSMSDVLKIAQEAARAGAAVIAAAGRDIGAVRVKASLTDVVTETDIAAGVAIVRSIMAADPNATFVIEEDEVYGLTDCIQGELDAPEVWVIDPLDGTTSFVHGFPCYSVSVALLRDGEPIAGAVLDVSRQELYSAAVGQGAHRDGAAIQCGATETLIGSLLVTGFPYDRGEPLTRQLAVLGDFLRAPVHGMRRDGSAAIDCCHVASGRADGFWEFGLKPWDMAAGVVICREAGARVTGIEGEPWTPKSTGIIVANPALHSAMREVILAR